jgi:hypothetical protein
VIAAALTAACGSDDADRPGAGASASAPAATGVPSAPTSSGAPSSAGGPAPASAVPSAAPSAPPSAAQQGPTEHRPASAPPVVLPQRPTGTPGAKQVVDAFRAAGLAVGHSRDRSVDCGPDGLGLGCSELIATDGVTVYVFPDETSASDIAETWGGQSYRRGVVVLNYLEAKTPATARPRYEKVLAGLR